MSRIRHRLLAIVALLLAMFTVTPSAMADMRGIDVSGWQSPTVTCTADYDFAVVKATQGTGFTNGYMTSQARCVQQRGKSLGFYHYAGGGNATAEADYFVNAVRPYLGVFCQVGVGRFGVSFSPCERRVSGRFGVGRSCWLLVIALVIA